MEVKAIPGLEHLPYAEAWFHRADDTDWRAASDGARGLGKTGLEAWTTTRTPEVVPFLAGRGFVEVRRYVISELDVAAAADPAGPAHALVSLAERPELAEELYALARVAYADQPGRAETRIDEAWFQWGLRAHPPEAYLVAVDGDRILGYGYLERDEEGWRHGFTAVARDARGRGVAGSIKRGQIAWARAHGIPALRTANEARLTGMLALNRRLGYVPLYDEVVLRGPLAA